MSVRKWLADKYDPSIMGGLAMVLPFIVVGGAIAAGVAALVGAGAAVAFGAAAATGATWGAGIVGTLAAGIVGINLVPPLAYQWAYKQEVKDHVRKGGSTDGCWHFPGIENLRPVSQPATKPLSKGIAIVFNTPPKSCVTPPASAAKAPPAPPTVP